MTTIIVVPADIVEGRCIIFGLTKSVAMRNVMGFLMNFVSYILPLMLMVFSYARIVHALRTKVDYNCVLTSSSLCGLTAELIVSWSPMLSGLIHNKMPCYRKDDRAMRPIAYMDALKIFESPCIATPV